MSIPSHAPQVYVTQSSQRARSHAIRLAFPAGRGRASPGLASLSLAGLIVGRSGLSRQPWRFSGAILGHQSMVPDGRGIRVSGEIAQVAADMVPYVTTALSAYGGAVLAKAEDDAADATVGFGRRLLQRIFGKKGDSEPLPPVLAKVVANPDDLDYLGTLRAAIRDELENDAQMLAEVREILAQAKPTVTAGPQSAQADRGGIAQNIVAGGNVNASHSVNNGINGPIISAGRDVSYSQGDMTIHRTAD